MVATVQMLALLLVLRPSRSTRADFDPGNNTPPPRSATYPPTSTTALTIAAVCLSFITQ